MLEDVQGDAQPVYQWRHIRVVDVDDNYAALRRCAAHALMRVVYAHASSLHSLHVEEVRYVKHTQSE